MGAGVSNWCLARAVSLMNQLGVVAGTALDYLMVRRLEDGDPDGHIRRALDHFPFPQVARWIVDTHFISGGRDEKAPYRNLGMHRVDDSTSHQALCVAANFVEVFLAREGHDGEVGINFLEKIQIPHLPSLYGAMLAGVAVVIVGAGIPLEFPAAIDALARHQPASYAVQVAGATSGAAQSVMFDPAILGPMTDRPALARPAFVPIISSNVLATALLRRCAPGSVQGFIIEGPCAGGHNAPPRGALKLTPDGEPIYGPRDAVDVNAIRALGLPFWLAGGYGTPQRIREARALGATGVQVGTPFAMCVESALDPTLRRALVRKALAGTARVFTDPKASPTGFPFKVAELEGTLSQVELYDSRRRLCDLGFLREPYMRPDGTTGYRCPAEPVAAYLAKGGLPELAQGRKCLCNALVANIGMPQHLADGSVELALVTLGDDYVNIGRFCHDGRIDFTAADVIRDLLA